MASRSVRILAVTVGLIGAGALIGASLGVFAMVFIAFLSGGPAWLGTIAFFLYTGAWFGAIVGAIQRFDDPVARQPWSAYARRA